MTENSANGDFSFKFTLLFLRQVLIGANEVHFNENLVEREMIANANSDK